MGIHTIAPRKARLAVAALLFAGLAVAGSPPGVAHAADSIPDPVLGLGCNPTAPPTLTGQQQNFQVIETHTFYNGTSQTDTQHFATTFTGTVTVTVSASVEVDLNAVLEQAKGTLGLSVTSSVSVTKGSTVDVPVPPWKTVISQYGISQIQLTYSVPLPAGCLLDPAGGLPYTFTVNLPEASAWKTEEVANAADIGPLPPPPGPVSPPSPPQPQPITSVNGLADGTLMATSDTQRIYKMVGGAPVWQSTCADGICAGTVYPTTQAVIDAGPAAPADGATAVDQQGDVFKFVGGAPVHLATCDDGVGCGSPVLVSTWSVAALDHMRAFPADGATLIDEQGDIFKFVGGAPIHLATCDDGVGCGTPVHVSTWSVANLDHMHPYPVDGATLIDEQGEIFKFVGGAPIHLGTCDDGVGCGTPVHISTWSVANLDHMLGQPQDGATLIDEQGEIFKFVGGAPIRLATCGDGVGCGTPVHISTWSVANLDHMLAYPANGSTVIDEQGDIFKFVGGAPIHLASCSVGCGTPVNLSTWSVANVDHMLPHPADGTTVLTDTGKIYRFVGGAPLYLSNCAPGCGVQTTVNQWSIDNREHMNSTPATGSYMEAVETGLLFQATNGEADLAGSCPGAAGCAYAVLVNQASIDPIAQSAANHGAIYGQLSRYVDPATGRHAVTTGSVPTGMRFENSLGQLSRAPAPGTTALYSCVNSGGQQFISIQSGCEGAAAQGVLGWIYAQAPAGLPASMVYRCSVPATGDVFASTDPTCEGQHVDGPAGYTIAYANLVRYFTTGSPGLHYVTTGQLPPGYRPEGVLGMVLTGAQPGTVPLYACQGPVSEFVSFDAACEGSSVLGVIGYVWAQQPAGVPTIEIYRCRVDTSGASAALGDLFVSNDPQCEGYHVDGPAGFVLARVPLARVVDNGRHSVSAAITDGAPGYVHEATYGYLALDNPPGTKPLYSCTANNQEYPSIDPQCEGGQMIGTLGDIWAAPPDASYKAVYRCLNASTGDRFISDDPQCEGQHVDGPAGYVATTP